jgi:hypothetical protein
VNLRIKKEMVWVSLLLIKTYFKDNSKIILKIRDVKQVSTAFIKEHLLMV